MMQALYDDLEQFMSWTAEEGRVRRMRRRRGGGGVSASDESTSSASEPEFSDDELPALAATAGDWQRRGLLALRLRR
jgi:hypothetical protein